MAYRQVETGIPGAEVAFPHLDKIKVVFDEWLTATYDQLHELICVKWDYPSRRARHEFSDSIALIIALSEFIVASSGLSLPNPVTLVTILTVKGLDMFCSRNSR